MKSQYTSIIRLVSLAGIMVLGVISIIASGGGGGGGTAAVTYSGVTTQAIIDENNAYDIAVATYTGGDVASDLNIFGVVSEDPDSASAPLF